MFIFSYQCSSASNYKIFTMKDMKILKEKLYGFCP
jgi:hypothetical protein